MTKACPRCGYGNPVEALGCVRCGWTSGSPETGDAAVGVPVRTGVSHDDDGAPWYGRAPGMQPPGRPDGRRAPSPGSGGPLQLTRFHSRSNGPAPTYIQPAEQEDPAVTTDLIVRPAFVLAALGLGVVAVVLMYAPEGVPTVILIGAIEGLVPFAIARCWEDGRFGAIALLVCVVAAGVLGPAWGGLVSVLLTVVAFNRNR